jgi:hypothetical protein
MFMCFWYTNFQEHGPETEQGAGTNLHVWGPRGIQNVEVPLSDKKFRV